MLESLGEVSSEELELEEGKECGSEMSELEVGLWMSEGDVELDGVMVNEDEARGDGGVLVEVV